ncbi:MAG TPA: PQQ-binding-like beta-propeller repeat protein [Burkholderiaceae bacterium]|nr:PQQ-binding-like beta-propeller repeat protein [Burkholderiaceae bacterium]
MAGQNISNTRSLNSALSTANAATLKLKWAYPNMPGDVSSTPALVDGALYITSWPSGWPDMSAGGYLTKLNATTGALIWNKRIGDYTGMPTNAFSRTSPAVANGVVYIGDWQRTDANRVTGARLLAINVDGSRKWVTNLDDHPVAQVTQSPIVYNGIVYVGVTSDEESTGAWFSGTGPCCTFRGSFLAVDAATGVIKWKAYMVPLGYSGAGVWGSTAAIDPASRTVYITTGNNYSVPTAVKTCQNQGNPPSVCMDPKNYVDSIVALNMDTGEVRWATGVMQWVKGTSGFDDWTTACTGNGYPQNCPYPVGPDYDFAAGPNLLTVTLKGNRGTTLAVGAGQKSGIYWMLDAKTGKLIWSTQLATGAVAGGIQWGTSTDGTRIYAASSNSDGQKYKSYKTATFAAMDASTGRILWQIPEPTGWTYAPGPVTVTNGVVLAGSLGRKVFAFNATNGSKLWAWDVEGATNAGPAVSTDGTIYWGNGYNRWGPNSPGAPSHTFYAFSIGGT